MTTTYEDYEKKTNELRATLDRYSDMFKSNKYPDYEEVRFKEAIKAAKSAGVSTDLKPWRAESLAYAHVHTMSREDWADESEIEHDIEIERIDDAVYWINNASDIFDWYGLFVVDEEGGEE